MHRDMGALYYGGLGGAAVLMGYHYRLIRSRERDACFKAFNQNNWVGAAIFAGIAADFALRRGIPWT
jgi:4-hydroxybenzoate polyprenyltransferase